MILAEGRYADLVIRTQQELPRKLAAYEALIKLSYPQVLGLALGITGDHDAASSVAQDVSIRVLHSVRKLQDPEKYQIWVRRITINVARSWLAKERREVRKRERYGLEPERNIAPETESPSFTELVTFLTESERTVVSLKILEDREFSEIAEITGMSLSAAKMRYYRSLEKIKVGLAQANEDVNVS